MYCTKCGKETSDGASFCPYCGAVIEQAAPEKIPEPAPERISEPAPERIPAPAQAPVVNIENQNEELPVYKRKKKGAFLVGFIPLIVAICRFLVACLALVTNVPRDIILESVINILEVRYV